MLLRRMSLLTSLLLLTSFSALHAQIKQSTRELVPMGTGRLETPSEAASHMNSANTQGFESKQDLPVGKPVLHGLGAIRALPTPVAPGKPVVGPGAGNSGFNGLDHTDSRNADGGNQFEQHTFEHTVSEQRWIRLDINKVVTLGPRVTEPVDRAKANQLEQEFAAARGVWLESRQVDLTKVDAFGFADLMRGSGHGYGGYVGMGPIEVYGKPVAR